MNRQVKQSPMRQGADERIAYTLTTTPWGSSPSGVVVKVVDLATGTDVTAQKTTGTASVTGDAILLPVIHSLAAGGRYRVEVTFLVGGQTLEAFCILEGEV